MVNVDAGQQAGREYKAGRKSRGDGPTPAARSLLHEATALGLSAKSDHPVADALADALTNAPCKPWRPQPYGGKELVDLLTKLRVDVVFCCPCNPSNDIKIGSLGTHRKMSTKCKAKLAERSGLHGALVSAAALMTDPTELATKARLAELPVLNVPTKAASIIEAAFGAATAQVKLETKPLVKADAQPTKPPSGAAKAKARKRKQAKLEEWQAATLDARRAREAEVRDTAVAAFEREVEALALAAIAARRERRRPAAQACLELMEKEATAKRRRTRRVLRRLQDRREENTTLDEMLGSVMLDEMLAVDGPQAAV